MKRTILQALRFERNVTQKQVGDAIGKPKMLTDISQAENGNYVKQGLRRALANYYGKEESEIFDEFGFSRGVGE